MVSPRWLLAAAIAGLFVLAPSTGEGQAPPSAYVVGDAGTHWETSAPVAGRLRPVGADFPDGRARVANRTSVLVEILQADAAPLRKLGLSPAATQPRRHPDEAHRLERDRTAESQAMSSAPADDPPGQALLPFVGNGISDNPPDPGDANDNSNAPKLGEIRAANTLDVKFAVIGDLHFESDYNYDSTHACWGFSDDKAVYLRPVSDEIRRFCRDSDYGPDCTAIVNVGDMLRVPKDSGHWDDSVAAYRRFYEYDHPDGVARGCCTTCDYCKYFAGYSQTRYPVFLGLGNHDDPTEWDDTEVQDYVRKRMQSSDALFRPAPGVELSNYYEGDGSDMYAWEWGNVHFIWLGLWAFYNEFYASSDGKTKNRSSVDDGKIRWLQQQLAATGKKKAIILFQHFGWDRLSLGEPNAAGTHAWWDSKDVELLGDVLCDRTPEIGGSTDCSDPYNVIGIFSGHLHDWDFHENIVIRGEYKVSSDSSQRMWTTIDERFPTDNYVVNDGGHHDGDTDAEQAAGFFLVRLETKTPAQAEGLLSGTMTVNQVGLSYGDGVDYPHDDCLAYQKYDIDLNPDSRFPRVVDFTTEFLRWEQGEPNNVDGDEHCAIMLPNGRYNDYRCSEERRVLCHSQTTDQWRSSTVSSAWKGGFDLCENAGWDDSKWEFDQPETPADLASAIAAVADAGGHEVWVNYTDLLKEGDWQQAPGFLRYFGDGEPNNGDQFFERGSGQNCLAVMADSSLHDLPCEDMADYYMCQASTGEGDWVVAKADRPRDWAYGYSVCGEGGFEGLSKLNDAGSFEGMIAVARRFFTANPEARAIWAPLSDLDKEGTWNDSQPWLASAAGWASRDGGDAKNCAALMPDGWHDVECEQSSAESPWPFACRNYQTGEWGITVRSSRSWVDGFEACRTELGLRYYYASPVRKNGNEDLNALRVAEGIPKLWLNYTDADADNGDDLEGFWRHGFWKNWYPGQPDDGGGNEDCVLAMSDRDGGLWADRGCSASNPILCRFDGAGHPGTWIGVGARQYSDAQSMCSSYDGYLFSYPTCPSEQTEVDALSSKEGSVPFWIQLNDINHEGYFTPW